MSDSLIGYQWTSFDPCLSPFMESLSTSRKVNRATIFILLVLTTKEVLKTGGKMLSTESVVLTHLLIELGRRKQGEGTTDQSQ